MESDQLQSILRMFNYGLYVMTCADGEGAPAAATVSWVTQVSFKPKLIAVALRKGTAICEAVRAERRFGLHVVGEQQPELARAFFKVSQVSPSDIGGYAYGFTERNIPILEKAVAWLECEVVEEVGASGDHAIFIASLLDGDVQTPGIRSLALRDTVWHYGG
jgi:flavin reductase (DIM6/NTAB) family NADH-FMN oxidoreductase RutF